MRVHPQTQIPEIPAKPLLDANFPYTPFVSREIIGNENSTPKKN